MTHTVHLRKSIWLYRWLIQMRFLARET